MSKLRDHRKITCTPSEDITGAGFSEEGIALAKSSSEDESAQSRSLKQIVRTFLIQNLDEKQKILLALSGGADSLALYHLLLEIKKEISFQLAIAHVDHGWRGESRAEALQLTELVKQQELPFHLLELDPNQFSGNLEDYCRKQRLLFFKRLCQEHHYQAVLLAHHKNDQAETVLKRLFEAGQLHGMRAASHWNGVALWRPLLEVSKEVIIDWSSRHGLLPFQDKTNEDPRFLRAKLRQRIIPYLSNEYGRDVVGSLCYLAEQSREVESLCAQLSAGYLAQIKQFPTGMLLDLSTETISHPLIGKHLMRCLCEKNEINLSKEQYALAAHLLIKKLANKQITTKSKTIYFDRGRVFVDYHLLPKVSEAVSLQKKRFLYGRWQVEVCPTDKKETVANLDWRAVCAGRLSVILPAGHYRLAPAVPSSAYPCSSALSKWWNRHKIPAFIRSSVPVVWERDRLFWEFLTGKREFLSKEGLILSLSLATHLTQKE